MKRITALLLAFVLMMSLYVTAYADGAQTTTISVNVPAGTYTAHIPEDVSFSLANVVNFTEKYKANELNPNFNIADDYVPESIIGRVYVESAAHCKYVYCNVTLPELKNGEFVLPCKILINELLSSTDNPSTRTFMTADTDFTLIPYQANRMDSAAVNFDGVLDSNGYGKSYLWLLINESDTSIAMAGTYTGTMSFTFYYSNTKIL